MKGTTRTKFRRGLAFAAIALTPAVALVGCSSPASDASSKSSGSKGTVTWAVHSDFATSDLISEFTKETGIKVVVKAISSSDQTRALLAAGGSGIDVVEDYSGSAGTTYDMGVLAPLDESKLSTISELSSQFKDIKTGLYFDGKRYGALMNWGTDSLVYVDKGGTGKEIDSIDALFDGEYAGKISMPAVNYESLLVAGVYLGFKDPFHMTDDQLDQVVKLLIKQKPQVRSYWSDIGDLENQMATGEVDVSWGWTPVLTLQDKGVDVRWAVPKEGQFLFYEMNLLTKDAVKRGNEANSLKFINFLQGAEYQQKLAEKLNYRPTNQKAIDALSADEQTKLELNDPAYLENAKVMVPVDTKKYQAAWSKVQNG